MGLRFPFRSQRSATGRSWLRRSRGSLLAIGATAALAVAVVLNVGVTSPPEASAEVGAATAAEDVGSEIVSTPPAGAAPTQSNGATPDGTAAPTGRTASVDVPRAADCPSATVRVSTAEQLRSAISGAGPGTVIRLAAGTYKGDFTVTASGTAAAPIWLCGPRSAVLTTASLTTGHPLNLTGVSNVVVAGFSIDNSFKGVTVVSSSRVAISDMSVTGIGFEAIHVRGQSHDVAVAFNSISRTGLSVAKYGEGIYLGTSGANWCKLNGCQADRTTRILVRGNKITDTGAQPIEAKEGTSDGYIEDNDVTGVARIEPNSKALILVKGNGYRVTGNTVNRPPLYGLQTIASGDDWGRNNSFASNTINGAPADGISIHQPGLNGPLGNIVYCSNRAPGARRLANVTCTP